MNTTATAVDAPPPPTPAASEAVERWVEHFVEGWRAPRGADGFLAHFRPALSPEIRLLQPQVPEVVGLSAFEEQFVRPLFALIPDLRGEVERFAVRGDTAYIEMTLRGTLAGRREVSWRVCDRVKVEDGLAVERESYFDPIPLLAAIACTPRAWSLFLRLQLRRFAG